MIPSEEPADSKSKPMIHELMIEGFDVPGKELKLSVRVWLHPIYKKFLDAVEEEGSNTNAKVEAALQCVVWGSLCLEALVNHHIEDLLAIWFRTRRPGTLFGRL